LSNMSTNVEEGSKGFLKRNEPEFDHVAAYMQDEFGFRTLEELDFFYNNLLLDAKKSNDERLQHQVVAYWERCSLEFLGYRDTVIRNLDSIRRQQLRTQEYKIEQQQQEVRS
jgi:hypothetical protein